MKKEKGKKRIKTKERRVRKEKKRIETNVRYLYAYLSSLILLHVFRVLQWLCAGNLEYFLTAVNYFSLISFLSFLHLFISCSFHLFVSFSFFSSILSFPKMYYLSPIFPFFLVKSHCLFSRPLLRSFNAFPFGVN